MIKLYKHPRTGRIYKHTSTLGLDDTGYWHVWNEDRRRFHPNTKSTYFWCVCGIVNDYKDQFIEITEREFNQEVFVEVL